jgi:hypothetical protein
MWAKHPQTVTGGSPESVWLIAFSAAARLYTTGYPETAEKYFSLARRLEDGKTGQTD